MVVEMVPLKGGIGCIFHPPNEGKDYKWHFSCQLEDGLCHLPPFRGTRNNHWLEVLVASQSQGLFIFFIKPQAQLQLDLLVEAINSLVLRVARKGCLVSMFIGCWVWSLLLVVGCRRRRRRRRCCCCCCCCCCSFSSSSSSSLFCQFWGSLFAPWRRKSFLPCWHYTTGYS